MLRILVALAQALGAAGNGRMYGDGVAILSKRP